MKWQALKTLLQTGGAIFVRSEGSHQVWRRKVGDVVFTTSIPVPHSGHDFSGVHLRNVLKSLGFNVNETENVATPVKKAPEPAKLAPEGSFGRKLYEARTAAGMSQSDLARLIHCGQSQLSSWERGASDPLQGSHGKLAPNVKQTLIAICEKFGFTDMLVVVKSAQEQIITKTRGRGIPAEVKVQSEPEVAPAPIKHNIQLVTKSGPTPSVSPSFGDKAKEVREFAKLIDADSIWIYVTELEQKVKRLEADAKRDEEYKHKAALYDKINEITSHA